MGRGWGNPARSAGWRHCAAVLLCGAAASAYGNGDDSVATGFYAFEVELAPVCLDGTYPLSIETADGPLAGTLTVTTDVRGRLAGSLDLGGRTFAVSGDARARRSGHSIELLARDGRDRISFAGEHSGTTFNGTARGRGAVAEGRNPFTLDVSNASPQRASLEVRLTEGRRGSLEATGTVLVCGESMDVHGRGSARRDVRLSLRGTSFRWTGRGETTEEGLVLRWSTRGFGAKASGDALTAVLIDPPADVEYAVGPEFEAEEPAPATAPTWSGGAPDLFTVEPPLAAGLTLDAATGVVSGTPLAAAAAVDHTITASNRAGSSETVLRVSVRSNRAKSLAPFSNPVSDDDRRHFLGRTHFGVRQVELDAFRTAGLTAFVDDMLDLRSGTAIEQAAFAELQNASDPAGLEGGFPSATQAARWWVRIMAETDRPFQEQLAFFWHDHLAVSSETFDTARMHWIVRYVNLLRHEGAGNLRELLVQISREPAMLHYLDGFLNRRGAPNENYAREFWELFSLGVDEGYTQDDIVQSAKAFTGWRSRLNATTGQYYAEFDTTRHDTGAKTILGVTIPAQNVTDDFEAVVDITLDNRPAAEFVCRKLFEWFCYPDAPQEVVDELAATLRANDWELRPVLRKLLLSEALFSPRARNAFAKSPLDFAVGFERSTGLHIRVRDLDSRLVSQGQRPTQPPTVDGWPTGPLWLSGQAMVERINFAHACISDTTRQRGVGIEVAAILPPAPQRTAESVVDTVSALLDVSLLAEDRTDLVDYLNTQRLADGSVIISPFDGASQEHLDTRVRGLLYALAQHPSYQVK